MEQIIEDGMCRCGHGVADHREVEQLFGPHVTYEDCFYCKCRYYEEEGIMKKDDIKGKFAEISTALYARAAEVCTNDQTRGTVESVAQLVRLYAQHAPVFTFSPVVRAKDRYYAGSERLTWLREAVYTQSIANKVAATPPYDVNAPKTDAEAYLLLAAAAAAEALVYTIAASTSFLVTAALTKYEKYMARMRRLLGEG